MLENKILDLKCEYCGKEFKRYKKDLRGNHNFCSHNCQISYIVKSQHKERTDVVLICPTCGKEFTRTQGYIRSSKSRKQRYNFCSKPCLYKYYKDLEREPNTIHLVCEVCGKEFDRTASTNKSYRKLFDKVCCSRACSIKIAKSSYCEDAKFRYILQAAKYRKLNLDFDIDVEYIKELYEKQNGICPYTGFELEFREIRNRGLKMPKQASLDRIDSKKGYVKGNVELVSLFANFAKNSWSRDEILACFEEIRNA